MNENLYVHSIDFSTIKQKKKSVYKTWENTHCVFDKSPYECQTSNRALADVLGYKVSFGLSYKQEQEKYKD